MAGRIALLGKVLCVLALLGARAGAATLNLNPDGDARILLANASGAEGTNTFLAVYTHASETNLQRSLLHFDLGALAGATIQSATLSLTVRNGWSSNGEAMEVYRVTRPWVESEVSWLNATTATAWTTAGGDYAGTGGVADASPYSSNSTAVTANTNPTLTWDVTSLVAAWAAGAANSGLLVRSYEGNSLHFWSREGTTAPTLAITYTPAPAPTATAAPTVEYRFDERTGATLGDGTGIAPLADGAISGATWTTSPYHGALAFDGVNDYVDLGSSNSKLDAMLSNPFTITGIARADSSAGGVLLARGDAFGGEQNKFIRVVLQPADATHVRLACTIRGDAGESAGTTSEAIGGRAVAVGEWFHFAVVRTGGASSALHVYVDGALEGSDFTDIAGSITFNGPGGVRPLALGVSELGVSLSGHTPGGYLNGAIALVRVFGAALRSDDVAEQCRVDLAGVAREPFDADPGWTGINNRSDGWSFGFGATSAAGGAAGEAGGVFTRSGATAFYADTDLGGAFTLADPVDASGRFDITGITSWNAGFMIGYFDPVGESQLGLVVLEDSATSVRVRARVVFADGTVTQTADVALVGLNVDRVFTLSYDPAGGASGAGRLAVSITGAGGVATALDLAAADRARAAAFSAFGFKAGAAPSPDTSLTATAFVDDLAYTTAARGATSFRRAVTSDAPYAYWRFNETSGATAADASGNGRAATYVGAVTLGNSSGLVREPGFALSLPTETAFVQGPANVLGTGAFTIEAVIKTETQRTGYVFWQHENQIWMDGAAIHGRLWDDQNAFVISSPPILAADTWYHIAFVSTGTALQLYVNGAAVATPLATSGLPPSSGSVSIGRDEGTPRYYGLVDEIAVYRQALPADRILAHSQAAFLDVATFFGEDPATASAPKTAGGRLASTPTSTAARAAFLAAATSAHLAFGTETFESFAIGADGQVAVSSFPITFGALPVTAVAERSPFLEPPDASFRLRNLAGGGNESGTYPISGAQYLITNIGHELRFGSAVNALGFYATDVETSTLSLDLYRAGALVTSTAVRPAPPNAPDGSVLFFGLVSNVAFDRAVFRGSGSDGFGYDDITVGVANTRIWAGPGGTAWGNAGRWTPLGMPAATDDVRIPAGSGSSIVTSPAAVRSLALLGGFAGAVTINAALAIERDLVVTSGTLTVGGAGNVTVTGSVTVDGGTLRGAIAGPGGPVTVKSGGTLKANVAPGRVVIVGPGGRVSPGN